jgi:hypothetical protein
MRKFLLLSSLVLLPLLAGCAPKAELTIDATKLTACAPQIDFSKAAQVPAVNEPGGASSPQRAKEAPPPPEQKCQEENGQKLAYTVLALPPANAPYEMTIKSDIQRKLAWRPIVRFFDANHRQVKEIAPTAFTGKSEAGITLLTRYVDNWLELTFTPEPPATYAVLITDASSLGAQDSYWGLVTDLRWVKYTKSVEDCDGSGANRKCRTKWVETEDLETVVIPGTVAYHFAPGGLVSANIRYQKTQP